MKTLKQIREETRSRIQISGVEEDLLEAKMDRERYASPSDMPMILVFKRRSYRIYPDKQTVALYYNTLTDKYLSIPFGPKGNLNVSEAQEVDEGVVGDWIEKKRQALHDRLKDSSTFKAAQKLGHNLPGYGNVQAAKEKWKQGDKLGAAKETAKSLGKAALTGAGTAAALGAGIKAAGAMTAGAAGAAATQAASGGSSNAPSSTSSGPNYEYKKIQRIKQLKARSGLAKEPTTSDATLKSKMKAADLKGLKESKITVLKKMVSENIQSQEILINDKPLTVSNIMAKKITEVYDSVNRQNKKQIETMLNESVDSFKNLLNFSLKN